jgi:hypothetical protein
MSTFCNNSVVADPARRGTPARQREAVLSGGETYGRLKTDSSGQGQQHVEAEVFPPTTQQPRHSRLRYSKAPPGLGLSPALQAEVLLQPNHHLSTQCQHFGLRWIKPKINENISTAFYSA